MTYAELAQTITNIRYGRIGKILFDANNKTYAIAEPIDVLLVGFNDAASALWIARNYSFLIA